MLGPLDGAVPARAGDAGAMSSLRQYYRKLAQEALASQQGERKKEAEEAGALEELRRILRKIAAEALAAREARTKHGPARPGSLADLRAHLQEIVRQTIEESQTLGGDPRALTPGGDGINLLV